MNLIVAALAFASVFPAQSGSDGWQQILHTPELTVWSRPHAGTDVNEMRAVGVVDARAADLWALVSDVEGHTRLLPHTTVSRVLRTEGDAAIALQRTETPFLDPREYVIAVRRTSTRTADGRALHAMSWRTAPQWAQAVDPAAVRIDVNQGEWTVEALQDGRSRITFQLLLDPAGSIPASFVNFSQAAGAERALAVLRSAAAN